MTQVFWKVFYKKNPQNVFCLNPQKLPCNLNTFISNCGWGFVTSFFCYWSVPFLGLPPVSQLHIRHSDETSLSALWTHASSRDGYIVQLFQSSTSTAIQTRTLSRDMRECTFNVLTPGRLYDITVTTTTKNLRSSATVKGRTCKVILPFPRKNYSVFLI